MSSFKIALIQLAAGAQKAANLTKARTKVLEAARNGANLIVLPECFNSPYGTQHFANYAEEFHTTVAGGSSESTQALSKMAQDAQVYLIGGSIPERSREGALFNTCTVWDPQGTLVAVHRKIHLFDVDFPGKMVFKESSVLEAGRDMTEFATPWGKVGLGICYDMRFPELAMVAARRGCIAMVYPGAFNTTTGPLHWELLVRARAVDNQIFVAACSPARDPEAGYQAWGHSMVVDPYARIIATMEEGEGMVYADVDLKLIEEVRKAVPVYEQRRFDVYLDVAR
ncbi:carbon-nitrogen hydrolase [Kickxella alabastrina]|uniref:carbon-nitrogen hydrolase n=1 Tax=Kickxella alabastrina TaxID=61397 RepID=UPI00221F42BD|nr:carbon-nitrogen hydrolase [Kickxella alabastrina]KAI7833208.1 carbon-nitrogen hydrolase [Kickxella alabastrina]